jgi:hypothetical protein
LFCTYCPCARVRKEILNEIKKMQEEGRENMARTKGRGFVEGRNMEN